MVKTLVSVIVPTYNRAYCLTRAIDSALGQTHGSVEVILVDDGSTDNTRAMIEERYGDDARVRYVFQKNQGVSTARNRAIGLAAGKYVAFLDSDDYWEPWKLEVQVACLEHRPELAMVWSDMKARNPDGTIAYERFLRKMYGAYRWFTNESLFTGRLPLKELVPGLSAPVSEASFWYGDIYPAMIMGSLVHTSTVLLRRSAALRNTGFNPQFRTGEDYDYHIRTCRLGPVGLVDLPTIEYQIDAPDRLTRSELKLAASLNFLKVVQRELSENAERIKLSKAMERELMSDAFSWIGGEYLAQGDTANARLFLLKALRCKPWALSTLRNMLEAFVPLRAAAALRAVKRRSKTVPDSRNLL